MKLKALRYGTYQREISRILFATDTFIHGCNGRSRLYTSQLQSITALLLVLISCFVKGRNKDAEWVYNSSNIEKNKVITPAEQCRQELHLTKQVR